MQSIRAYHFGIVISNGQKAGEIKEIALPMLFHTWLGLLHYYLLNSELFTPGESVLHCRGQEIIQGYAALVSNEQKEKR